jgi:DNA-directed RNA polymerase subunit RPC12/RpoP
MSSIERQSDERDELIACPECGWEIAEKNIAEHYRIIIRTTT